MINWKFWKSRKSGRSRKSQKSWKYRKTAAELNPKPWLVVINFFSPRLCLFSATTSLHCTTAHWKKKSFNILNQWTTIFFTFLQYCTFMLDSVLYFYAWFSTILEYTLHCCEDLSSVLLLIPFYTKEFQHVELEFVTEIQITLYSSSSTVPCTVARIYPAFFCSSLFTL